MSTHRIRPFVMPSALGVILACALIAPQAAQQAAPQAPPVVKQKTMDPVPSVQGRSNFVAYCASCHGLDGKGQGPVAPALKMPVPDLTTIAKRKGKFDNIALERVIAGDDKMPAAHGSLEMPVWGPIFRNTVGNASATLRIRNLVKYLETIQVHPTE
ncbi:hypothetical protein TBR22_A17920 [Luteitalea sp. TBR-22]|uniref:c-type cytochrome n=1 Tax=Luteitalea sp. TBR-22 TaxID=2802971 RepID=UPI001AF4A680|nr:cytochrome c [Luteitalea sp. TBR-22]BCS32578.1 hypothetical protein TBR22_A17920 [Luteitalea sp. TBR-22]